MLLAKTKCIVLNQIFFIYLILNSQYEFKRRYLMVLWHIFAIPPRADATWLLRFFNFLGFGKLYRYFMVLDRLISKNNLSVNFMQATFPDLAFWHTLTYVWNIIELKIYECIYKLNKMYLPKICVNTFDSPISMLNNASEPNVAASYTVRCWIKWP